MDKDIKQIYSKCDINNSIINIMPKDELDRYIKHKLIDKLSDFIMKDIDNLPIKLITSDNESTDSKEFIVKINIISDDELRRLRMIEAQYENLCAILNKDIKEE